ncbi:MAG TPA: hypothetical protein VFG32_01545 [Bacteroidota bacterium]|nr:hypothetical protein [Bacteroidota bacterium]
MRLKKIRTAIRANMPMSGLLNTPLIDPRDSAWGNDLLQAQQEMTPVQISSLSPVEYMIFSGKSRSFMVDPFEK